MTGHTCTNMRVAQTGELGFGFAVIQFRQRNQVGSRSCTLISRGVMRGWREQRELEQVRKRITLPLVTRQSREEVLHP